MKLIVALLASLLLCPPSSAQWTAQHQFDAIFLTGLPDVPGSLPHQS
jgi:hypothetical protein